MPATQLHSVNIEYRSNETNRSMQVVHVKDIESLEPVDFDSLVPAENAEQELRAAALSVVNHLLSERTRVIGEPKPMQNVERVSSFLGGLAIKPFGRLVHVDCLNAEDAALIRSHSTEMGLATPYYRQAFVFGDFIRNTGKAMYLNNPQLPRVQDTDIVEEVAAHELVHLAGFPDIAYFTYRPRIVDGQRRVKLEIESAPTILEAIVGGRKNGAFFEEGFASLCGLLYLWSNNTAIANHPGTIPTRAPNGLEIELPSRYYYAAYSYAFAALALERLVDVSPRLWDILRESRVYGTSPISVRGAVRAEIDKIDSRLFDMLDKVDPHNLQQSMSAVSITDTIVRNVSGQ